MDVVRELGQRVAQRVGQVIVTQIDLDVDTFPPDDLARNADDGRMWRDLLDDDRTGAHLDVVADLDIAQYGGSCADGDAVADGGMPLADGADPAEGDALVDGHVVPYDGRLSDYDADGVVDEEALADRGARVNIAAGQHPGPIADTASEGEVAALVLPVRDAVGDERMEAWAEQRRLQSGLRSGVPLHDHLQVFFPAHVNLLHHAAV